MEITKTRYPGLRPFTHTENNLFFGRDKEIHELISLLSTEQMVVLFSKSGVGKSSLIYAGLIPRLKALKLFPIRVRLHVLLPEMNAAIAQSQNTQKLEDTFGTISPVSIFERCLADAMGVDDTPVTFNKDEIRFNKESPGFWEFMKVFKLPEDITPLLIFDQFEEFFSFPISFQRDFSEKLSEILHAQTPNRILDHLGSIPREFRNEEDVKWIAQPRVKCLFAIRDDRISEMDSIKKHIPLILRNRYKLYPLTPDEAKSSIEKPAALQSTTFASKTFTYDPATLNTIINKLSGMAVSREEYNPDIDGIDGSQLQKICCYIEKHIIENRQAANVEVDETIIKGEIDIDRILDEYYTEQLNSLGNANDINLASHLIEEYFISRGARTFLTEKQILDIVDDRKDIITKLIDARLIKEEHIHLGKGYELSHDSLIQPVNKASQERALKEEKKEKEILEAKYFDALRENEEKERLNEELLRLKNEAVRQKEIAEKHRYDAELARMEIQKRIEESERINAELKTARELAEQKGALAEQMRQDVEKQKDAMQRRYIIGLVALFLLMITLFVTKFFNQYK